MAHAAKSPLYGALESLVEEEVGRDASCPNGAGVLRKSGSDACRDERTGLAVTGAGGEHWCVNCHAPGENLRAEMPAWGAHGSARSREPMRDLLPASSMEGISCAACHQTTGPVSVHAGARGGAYEGNPTWTSFLTGSVFSSRPEDAQGVRGIANSGYLLNPAVLLGSAPGIFVHRRPREETTRYLKTSEFCGACHDVRLFGSDAVGAPSRGEHFKRLRNAYSEWRAYADEESRLGRSAPTCQGCHMSLYPGTCDPANSPTGGEPDASGTGDADCGPGARFTAHAPGVFPRGRFAAQSPELKDTGQHYFTSVDVPLTDAFPDAFIDDPTLDAAKLPIGLRQRRDLLLRHTFRFAIGDAKRTGNALEIPIAIKNTGAGHRVPAGFSQEREIWVELTVNDARGDVVYEVGKISAPDADLRDKIFLRVNTGD